MALTINGLRRRRLIVARRIGDFQRRRAGYLAKADNLDGAIKAFEAEIAKLDAAIEALNVYDRHISTKPPRIRGPKGKRNAARDEAIVAELTQAGVAGLTAMDIYDALDRSGQPLPSRQGFKVHLSYFGRSGKIVFRNNRWMLGELAPPLPPPAIHEAERLISTVPGGMTRAEIEAELKARAIPYSAKSLQTQLSERLRRGALLYRDGWYSFPVVEA